MALVIGIGNPDRGGDAVGLVVRGNVLYHRYDGHYGLVVPSSG